jgi:peptide/nickel transport system substrate-binding protein
VGSGQFRFGKWSRASSFELLAVEGHPRGTPATRRLIWTITPEYKAGVLHLLGGALDVFPNLRGESVEALVRQKEFNVVSLPGMDYVFMQLNLRDSSGQKPHTIFGVRDVRRALTMALDRNSMVTSLFDSLASVSVGPAVRAFPTTDTLLRQIEFNPEASRRILDSLGWHLPTDSAASGVRRRNGKPLRFRVLVPVSSLSRMRMAVLMQSQFRAVGAEMVIDQMDYSAFSARQAGRDFDAALASWHLGSSPEAVRVTWTSQAARRDGLNYGAYRNNTFDALVDSALLSQSLPQSRDYFRRANQIIIDDAPAIWLYEPKTLIAIHGRISTPPLRPNAWWLSLAQWKIRPEQDE